MFSFQLYRTQMVPTVFCQERTSNQSSNIHSGQAAAVLQPTVSTSMTSLRLESRRPTATRQHLLTTPFRSTDMKAEDRWLGRWVPWSLSQQSLTWIMTICRVGGRGLRSWRICTGPKTAPFMMGMMAKTLNSGLIEWTPLISDLLIPWGFVNWGLMLLNNQLYQPPPDQFMPICHRMLTALPPVAPAWSFQMIC